MLANTRPLALKPSLVSRAVGAPRVLPGWSHLKPVSGAQLDVHTGIGGGSGGGGRGGDNDRRMPPPGEGPSKGDGASACTPGEALGWLEVGCGIGLLLGVVKVFDIAKALIKLGFGLLVPAETVPSLLKQGAERFGVEAANRVGQAVETAADRVGQAVEKAADRVGSHEQGLSFVAMGLGTIGAGLVAIACAMAFGGPGRGR